MKNKSIYIQVKEKALPIMTHYADDLLKHDRADLVRDKGRTPFLHFTGPTGTHLVFMQPADYPGWPQPGEYIPYLFGRANRRQVLAGKVETVESMKGHHWKDLVLYYNGLELQEIDCEEAERIINKYQRDTLLAWHN